MTEIRGSCEDCAKTYRLPRAQGTFRCKACGGSVRAALILEDTPVDADEEREDRAQARRELATAYRTVRAVRMGYLVVVGLSVIVALGSLRDLARAFEGGHAALLLGSLAWWVLPAVALTGYLRIHRHPLLWSLLFAIGASLLNLGLLLFGAISWVLMVITVLAWFGVLATVPVQRLVREHPDLYVSRRVRGEARKAPAGGRDGAGVGPRHRRTGPGRTDRTRRRVWLAMGAVVLALAAGLFLMNRPQGFDSALADFRKAWNGGEAQSIVDRADPDQREALRRALEEVVGQPRLTEEPRVGETGRQRTGAWGVPGGSLETDWVQRNKRWVLVALPAPLGDLPERVLAAWNAGSVPEVAALARDPQSMARSIGRLMESRGWERLPVLENVRSETTANRVTLEGDTPLGTCTLTLGLRDHRWVLRRIRPPERESAR